MNRVFKTNKKVQLWKKLHLEICIQIESVNSFVRKKYLQKCISGKYLTSHAQNIQNWWMMKLKSNMYNLSNISHYLNLNFQCPWNSVDVDIVYWRCSNISNINISLYIRYYVLYSFHFVIFIWCIMYFLYDFSNDWNSKKP